MKAEVDDHQMTARELLAGAAKYGTLLVLFPLGVLFGSAWHIEALSGWWRWVHSEFEIVMSGVVMFGVVLLARWAFASTWLDRLDHTQDNARRIADAHDTGKALTQAEATLLSGLARARAIQCSAGLAVIALAMLTRALWG